MRITFEKVELVGTKKIRDESGKIRIRTKRFMQTISPFNTACGRPKTRDDIMTELRREREFWLAKEGV